MKFKKTLVFGISALLIGGAFSSAILMKSKNNEIEANAAVTITRAYLDLSSFDRWGEASATFKLHTWSNETGDVYTPVVKVSDTYYYADYDFTKAAGYRFTRYSSDGSSKWNEGAWNSTENNYYYKPTDWTSGNWSAPATNWSIKGGVSPWTTTTIDDPISTLTFDDNGLQYSVKSYELKEGTEFKIVGGNDWYGYKSDWLSALAKEYLSGEEDGNISVNKTATFDIYCKPVSKTYWIQIDSLSEAKKFSLEFLESTADICSDYNRDNKTALEAIWSDQKSSFEAMTTGARVKFNDDSDEVIVEARERYQHIIVRYGLEQWNGAIPINLPNLSKLSSLDNVNESVSTIVITTFALLTASIGALYLKRRKVHK